MANNLKKQIDEQMEKNGFHSVHATNKNEDMAQLERDRQALEYYNNLSEIDKMSFQKLVRLLLLAFKNKFTRLFKTAESVF